jgi:hypothetical protein
MQSTHGLTEQELMKYNFCTYFDRNYLAKGLCLISSLIKHHGDDVRIFVVCMDEITRLILLKLSLIQVIPIPLHEIEEGDQLLLGCRNDRSLVEYLWTSTPTIILRILERNSEIETITYVDADMFCYANTQPIFDELSNSSVMIHEHRFPDILAHLVKYGRFNVGLLVFRRDSSGFEVLNWWRERCIEWCKAELVDNKFGDQRYLDSWPEQFKGVKVTENIGIGTAPWNHSQYIFHKQNDRLFVNNTPLLIYHFHAFNILNEGVIVPVANTDYLSPISFFTHPVIEYIEEVFRSTKRIRSIIPDFNFGLEKKDFQLTANFGFIVKNDILPHLDGLGFPSERHVMNKDWTLFPGNTTIF